MKGTMIGIRREGISGSLAVFIKAIIREALEKGATEIQFEPEEKLIRERLRIDGILYNRQTINKKLLPALATRLKIMAGLDINEFDVSQSGSTKVTIGKKVIDLRVSTFPNALVGESIVLRLLDKDRLIQGLENLGTA